MTKLETSSTPKVYAAIVKVMQELAAEGISKGRSNKQQGYQFRGIDDVYNALSSCLSKAGLCVLPRVMDSKVAERQTKSGGNLFYTTLTVEYDLVCAEDGSKHTICTVGEAMDSADKSSNKAMSAAFKYACIQAFCIPTEGDNDADATTHEIAPRRAPELAESPLTDEEKKAAFWKRDHYGVYKDSDPIRDVAEGISRLINNAPTLEAITKVQNDNLEKLNNISKSNPELYKLVETAVKSRQSILIQAPAEGQAA